MKIYLGGYPASTTAKETRMVKAGAVRHRCVSFANVVKMPGFPYFTQGIYEGFRVCEKAGVGIMMDSGVFSFRRYKRKLLQAQNTKKLASLPSESDYISRYVDYCRANGGDWDFCVTVDLDLDGRDNFRRHVELERQGLKALPVFHGDDNSTVDLLRAYKDRGYSYICLGSSPFLRTRVREARQYYDTVFNVGEKWGIKYHGLAVTRPWLMMDYPWESVDSSAWSVFATNGKIVRFSESTGRLSCLVVAKAGARKGYNLNSATMQRLSRELAEEGFDLAELQEDHTARHIYNAIAYHKMADLAGRSFRKWRILV